MTPDEQVDMLRRCRDEIVLLRGHIARLEPKAEAYDALVKVLRFIPNPPQGYAEDVVWRIEREIETIERLRTPSDPPPDDYGTRK